MHCTALCNPCEVKCTTPGIVDDFKIYFTLRNVCHVEVTAFSVDLNAKLINSRISYIFFPGTLIPNVNDCGMYKICLDDGSSIGDYCPSNLPYFDYAAGLCSQDPGTCYNLCDPCDLYCTHEGKVPDPLDCMMYYYCDPPLLSHFECPNDETFNPDTLVCEENLTGNCTNLC